MESQSMAEEGGAALLRLNDMSPISGGPGKAGWWDKVPSKFEGWGENRFATPASVRCPVRSCAVRRSSPATSC